ncbi:response regulator transcription factor [Streptomyces chrestomyceticus]|uniref:response regulator transcription factor n=1 Tax=Streptomyces chrestomyceticus TaxID=68185 RepID=UPI0019D20792|nr:response regulator transcription factor [Streptomyces chrestomyceticus]
MRRILLVEDDPQVGPAIRRGLTAEGYAVDIATDGVTGLALALAEEHDVIVLDVMLPGLHGYGVCGRLRAAGVTTPVLMLTAKDGEHDEAEGLDTGADDYLTKPFSYVVLLSRLRALLRRGGRAGTASVLSHGDLWADLATRRAGRGSTAVHLTGKQFGVLVALMRAEGRVLSKGEILDEVWDPAFRGDASIVEVYVSALRRKIDAPFGTRSIETVRGYGYRLAATGSADG